MGTLLDIGWTAFDEPEPLKGGPPYTLSIPSSPLSTRMFILYARPLNVVLDPTRTHYRGV